jgi:hypothetical protein
VANDPAVRFCPVMPLCEQREHIASDARPRAAPLLPPFRDARWDAERQAAEFGVEIGEYRGVVRVPRRVLRTPLPGTPHPLPCVEAYYPQRTRFESMAERKLRRGS